MTQEQDGQSITQTADFGEYKEVNGVLFPHSMTISGGGMPMPLQLNAHSVIINGQMDESVFAIE